MHPGEQLVEVLSAVPGGVLVARIVAVAHVGQARYPTQPSVITIDPGSTWSPRKARSDFADALGSGAIRHRPSR